MKTKIYIVALFTLLFTSACEKGDLLYTDPSNPLQVTPQTLLTSMEVNTFMTTEGDLARITSILVQQMAGSAAQYQNVQDYDLRESDYNNLWAAIYAGTVKNADIMISEQAEKNPYYSGIARIIMAMNISLATDIWGDVPFSDAFQAQSGNLTPKFDTQEQVYTAIQSQLDAAIAELSKPESANILFPGSDDLIFNGDIEKWVKAAWTLKARYANRLSLKDPQGSANKVLEYVAKGLAANADNMEAKHSATATSQNQWGAYENQRKGNMVANKTFVDALLSNNDPRLPFYFNKTTEGTYVGGDISQTTVSSSASPIGSYFGVDQNYAIVPFHEAKFLEAEARQRLGQDASTALNDAIKASVSYATKGANTGESIAIYTAATATKTAILSEKWKAMFGHIEAYNDFRRTGIPNLTPRPGSAGAISTFIPKRFPTPQNERQNNPNAKVNALDLPVWWATN